MTTPATRRISRNRRSSRCTTRYRAERQRGQGEGDRALGQQAETDGDVHPVRYGVAAGVELRQDEAHEISDMQRRSDVDEDAPVNMKNRGAVARPGGIAPADRHATGLIPSIGERVRAGNAPP